MFCEGRTDDMVKHVIIWTLKEEFTEIQANEIKAGIKEGLESLAGKIPEIGRAHV